MTIEMLRRFDLILAVLVLGISLANAETPATKDTKGKIWMTLEDPSGVGFMGPEASKAYAEKIKAKLKEGHTDEETVAFTIPPYKGERYMEKIPDTLDLAQCAELVIRGMTNTTDPKKNYLIYFLSIFSTNPPVLKHGSDDCQILYLEAMPLVRTMTGSDYNSFIDRIWAGELLKGIGPDGLFYFFVRPWAPGKKNEWKVDGIGASIDSTSHTLHYIATNGPCNLRSIAAFAAFGLHDPNPLWNQSARRMIDRLVQVMTDPDKDKNSCLPGMLPDIKGKKPDKAVEALNVPGDQCRALTLALMQYYRATGYKPALDLAGNLSRFIMRRINYFNPDGSFLGHFETHTGTLLSLLEYGVAAKDPESIEFVKKGYDWAKSTKAESSSLIGWFTEGIEPNHPVSETCSMTEMVALALKMSQAGVGDYWDDADRWLRNQFTVSQLTSVDWITSWTEKAPKRKVLDDETSDSVVQRTLGCYSAYTTGNDIYLHSTGMAACCVGNSARLLYYAWENILHVKEGEMKINLLLNRASKWADVYFSIPYEGRVAVKIKQPLKNVSVRVPEWIESGSDKVVGTVNGEPRKIAWEGRYVDFGPVQSDDKLTLTFPISIRTVSGERVGGAGYTYTIKGNTVIAVEPRGKYHSLYQRDRYRADTATWVERRRFVPETQIDW